MKLLMLIVLGVMGLAACSREPAAPAPAPAPAPATGKPSPGPTIVKQTEALNTPRPDESQAQADMRGLIRMESLPCDRVIEMQAGADGQGGVVTCGVGEGRQVYAADRNGRFAKR